MYWPIGAPRIYAATSSTTSSHRRPVYIESDDEPESHENTEESGLLVNTSSTHFENRVDHERLSEASTPITPITPGIKPVEHDTQRRQSFRTPEQNNSTSSFHSDLADAASLLALRISRTGHLFAVITSTSLTIWQTKVRTRKLLLCTG